MAPRSRATRAGSSRRAGSCSTRPTTTALWQLVGRRRRGVLGVDLGLLRASRRRRRTSACSATREMPGAPLVPRRAAQLRRARLPRQATRRPSRSATPRELRPLTELTWGELRAPTAADRRRPARARRRRRATASSPTCRTSPRRSSAFLACASSARSGRPARRTSARAASSTASRRSSRRCCSPSTATATAAATSTAARSSAGCGGDADARGTPSCSPYLGSRPARRARSPWDELPCAGAGAARSTFAQVPFDHPLWVLYSLRHDRPAEGDRARPRRDPARAPQEAAPAPRRAGRTTASSGSRRPAG